MDEFTVKGDNGNFFKIEFINVFGFPNTTGPFGGYDTESYVEIKVGGFAVKSTVYSSTGEVYDFYNQLSTTNERLTGSAYLRNYEQNLDIEIKYDPNGRALVVGSFSTYGEFATLKFEFLTDQSYIQSTLRELKSIVEKYGGMRGIK